MRIVPEALEAAKAAYLKRRAVAGPRAAHWSADAAAGKMLRKLGFPVCDSETNAGAWEHATLAQAQVDPS